MSIQITEIRLSGGTGHEYIARLWWTNAGNNTTGDNTRAEIVTWLEASTLNTAFVRDRYGNQVTVGVVTPASGAKYLRTFADGKWTDNLLALPQK